MYPYAAHPETGLWCLAYCWPGEEPYIWLRGEPFPDRLRAHIEAGGMLRAWNAQFERIIWRDHCVPRLGWPEVRDDQYVCTMAEARAMSLPGALELAAGVTKQEHQKDVEGGKLMMRMTKPRDIQMIDGVRTIIWWDIPEHVARLGEYCKQDIRTEMGLANAVRRLGVTERQLYLLDQKMNDRGMRLDVDLINAAKEIIEIAFKRANQQIAEITGGAVAGVTKIKDLKQWLLETETMPVSSMDKAAVREMLTLDLSKGARMAIELRADAARTSLKKLDSMLGAMTLEGYVKGMLKYHAATTGRWGGFLVQPQNFPRPTIDNIEEFVGDVLAKDMELIELFYSVFDVVVSMLRSMLIASEDCRLIAADYSAIEARVLNWLAGQSDYVEMFRRGEDVYVTNAMRMYKIPREQVNKFPQRHTGKFQELGCGFQMGPKKAVDAAKEIYGLDITPEEAQAIVSEYRARHPKVVELWKSMQQAALDAVREPGKSFRVGEGGGGVRFVRAGGYLYMVLPSGRPLAYPAPRVEQREPPWSREARLAALAWNEEAAKGENDALVPVPVPAPEYRDTVVCWGMNSMTHQWEPYPTYGGFWTENAVQAIARDLMAEAMLRVDRAGYPVVLCVHDEIITDTPNGHGSLKAFEDLLCVLPLWAEGCPITAEGWEGHRYRK